jgi:hypothetical protein
MGLYEEAAHGGCLSSTIASDTRNPRIPVTGKPQKRFWTIMLFDTTTAAIEAYQSDLLNDGLQAGGVNRIVNVLKAMMTTASDWNMISENELK